MRFFRSLQIFFEIFFRPLDTRRLHCRRIFEIAFATGFPADNAVKGGAELFLAWLQSVTGTAFIKDFFAEFRISFRPHRTGEEEDSGNRDTSQFRYRIYLKGPLIKIFHDRETVSPVIRVF